MFKAFQTRNAQIEAEKLRHSHDAARSAAQAAGFLAERAAGATPESLAYSYTDAYLAARTRIDDFNAGAVTRDWRL